MTMELADYSIAASRIEEHLNCLIDEIEPVTNAATKTWIDNGKWSSIQHTAHNLELALSKALTAASKLMMAVHHLERLERDRHLAHLEDCR